MINWIGLYLAIGVLWAMWQSQSRFATEMREKAHRDGQLYLNFLGFVIVTIIWPIGLIGYLVFFIMRIRR